jgi:hypothetical protein
MTAVATSIPIAHAGHWLVWLLYALPILAVLGAIAVMTIRARRADARGDHDRDGVAG